MNYSKQNLQSLSRSQLIQIILDQQQSISPQTNDNNGEQNTSINMKRENDKEEIDKMIRTTKKEVPEDPIFQNWKNWFLFPDKAFTTNSPYSRNVELDELKLNETAEGCPDQQTHLLTKPISKDNPILFDDFLKDWNILSKSSDSKKKNHQVMLRHNDNQGQQKIDNILLISRGGYHKKLLSVKN